MIELACRSGFCRFRIFTPTVEKFMIDHAGFSVSDYERAKAFYERALAPRATS
jgi:hypothetical protein